jgi:hypothetical protein
VTSTTTGPDVDPEGARPTGATATGTATTVSPTLSPTAAVVAGLAVPGLDLRTARAVVDARSGRRIRARRSVLGGLAAIAAIALAVAVFPRSEPERVVADADRTTTTTEAPSTTTTLPPVTVSVPPVPSTTAKPVTTTTAVRAPTTVAPTTVAPTTLPPVQPLAVAGYTVAGTAGSNLTLTVNWTDPTPGQAPNGVRGTVIWGSGPVNTPDTQVPCTAPGTPIVAVNRYAATGQSLIQVELTRCNGTGDSSELQVNASVPPPKSGYVVVVGGAPAGQSPDALEFDAGGAKIPARTPDLAQTDADRKPVTVLTVPAGFSGPLVARLADGTCVQTAAVNPSTPVQPTVLLGAPQACAATGSTVP